MPEAVQSSPKMLTRPMAEKPVATPFTAFSKSARPSPSESGSSSKRSSTTPPRRLSLVRIRPLTETKRMASGKMEKNT